MNEYEDCSREDLIKKINELTLLTNTLKEEKNHEELLNFPWVGNLGNWCWNIETNNVVCNDQKVLALKYSKDEIPKNIGFEFFTSKLHPEDYERVMEDMRQHLYGNTAAYEVEYRIQAKDGSWKWYYDRGKVTKIDEKNQPVLIAGIVFDITEAKEMELFIKEQNKKLLDIVKFDCLTNTLNRKALYTKLESEISKSDKNNSKLSVVMIDVDRFKKVNDTHGHMVGDLVLKQVADTIENNLSEEEFVGRYGGEEFLVVLPNTDKEQGYLIAEKIRKDVENLEFIDAIKVTISGGLKEYSKEPIDILVDESDKCLYRAKNSGRNKIVYDQYLI